MGNLLNKLRGVLSIAFNFLHKVWLNQKPVILFSLKVAIDAFKPVLEAKIEECKDKFVPDDIADFIIGFLIKKAEVLFKKIPVIKNLVIGLLVGFEPKVSIMLQAQEDGVHPKELSCSVMDKIYIDLKKRV